MEEETESRVQELLTNYSDIELVIRGRDALPRIDTSKFRLLLFFKRESPQQKKEDVVISILPLKGEEPLGFMTFRSTNEGVQVKNDFKSGEIDPEEIITTVRRGLEFFIKAREIGFRNFPYSRITDSLQEEDLWILRLVEKHFSRESGFEFTDPKDYPDQMLRILKEAQISP